MVVTVTVNSRVSPLQLIMDPLMVKGFRILRVALIKELLAPVTSYFISDDPRSLLIVVPSG